MANPVAFIEDHNAVEDDGKTYGLYRSDPQFFSDTYLSVDEDTPIGDIFRMFQREYGRCVSKVYIDTEDGVKAIGWVFQKREKYEDSDKTYIREVWITLLDKYETRVEREYHTI